MHNQQQIFPSANEIIRAIDEIRKIKWTEFDGKNINSYLSNCSNIILNILPNFPLFNKLTSENFTIPFKFYRARPYEQIINEKLFCEYSYPIPKLCGKGRANLIHYPVFYASSHPLVALFECIQNIEDKATYSGKEYVISKWEIIAPGKFSYVPLYHDNFSSSNIFSQLKNFNKEDINGDANKINDDQFNAFQNLINFQAELFLSDEIKSISSYLSHRYIYENPYGHCFLIYPSKCANYLGDNFAFHPNFVDHWMNIEYIYRFKINDITEIGPNNYKISYSTNEVGVNNEHTIKWCHIDKHLDKFKKIYKKDFKEEFNSENLSQ